MTNPTSSSCFSSLNLPTCLPSPPPQCWYIVWHLIPLQRLNTRMKKSPPTQHYRLVKHLQQGEWKIEIMIHSRKQTIKDTKLQISEIHTTESEWKTEIIRYKEQRQTLKNARIKITRVTETLTSRHLWVYICFNHHHHHHNTQHGGEWRSSHLVVLIQRRKEAQFKQSIFPFAHG